MARQKATASRAVGEESVVPAAYAKHAVAAVWLPVDQVMAWDENPRDNREAVGMVVESIERFGFVAPVCVWTSKLRIVAGHTRVAAFETILARSPEFVPRGAPGPRLVPVRFHEFRNEKEATAYAIADNRLNEIAEWKDKPLAEVLETLRGDSLLAVTGFAESDLTRLLAKGAPEPPKNAGEHPELQGASKVTHTCPQCGFAWSA